MKKNLKDVEQMLVCLKDLGILSLKGDVFKVEPDFDLVVRGLIIKKLKRLPNSGMEKQIKQAQIDGIVEALDIYGFFNVCQKHSEQEFGVNCLLTFKKGES